MLAGGLRLRAVNLIPIDYDEDDYLRAGQEFARLIRTENWRGFLDTNYRPEHPPLGKLAYGLIFLTEPEVPLVPDASITAPPATSLPKNLLHKARLTAMAFGVLEVGLVAVINPLAGFFLAIHTFTIKYTSEAMLDALPALLSICTALAYLRYKKNQKTVWYVVSALLLGLTVDSKYLYFAVGIAILLDWFFVSYRAGNMRQFFPHALGWGLIAVGIFIALNPFLWSIDHIKETITAIQYTTATSSVIDANFPPWYPLVWLSESVPWHPGVFTFSLDTLILLLALFGLIHLWRKEPLFVFWLGVALLVLIIWRTKWPQYILVLTAPLSIASAEGFQAIVWNPLKAWWAARGSRERSVEKHQVNWRESLRAIPWLTPGLIALILLAAFPLIFQFAMALTDYNSISIRDGINGGVWREVWLGLTGQVKPINFDPSAFLLTSANKVHFTGFDLLASLLEGAGNDVLIFSFLWALLSLTLQTALGVSVALMLNRPGVRFVSFWRTIFILPWAIPEFIGALIWLRTFQPQVGWFGMLLPEGVPLPHTFDSIGFALMVLLVAATWYGFPFLMLAATASLKLVPTEVYEAASLDGADGWKLFSNVTWPLLLPLLVPAIIIRSIFAFNQFYLFYVMQPPSSMYTLASVSYSFFARGNQYAISAAINVFTVAVLILALWFSNRWSKASEGVTYA